MLGGSTPVHFVRKLRVKGAWGRRSREAWDFLKVCEGCHMNLETECGKPNEPIICGSFLPAFLQKKWSHEDGWLWDVEPHHQGFHCNQKPVVYTRSSTWVWEWLLSSFDILIHHDGHPHRFRLQLPKKVISHPSLIYWLNQIMQDAWWFIVGMERNDLYNIHTQLSNFLKQYICIYVHIYIIKIW